MVENDRTVVIDASTAFRVDDDWTYGFPGTLHILLECVYFVFLVSVNTPHIIHVLTSYIVYDYLELCKSQKEALQSSKRISNPGCYPTGFIALTRPLVDAGIIPADAPLTVNAISGYSGGGNALIDIYESDEHEPWGAYGYSMVRLVQFTCVVSYLILHLGHL